MKRSMARGPAIADGSDPLLLAPWVDKPPLVLYLLALAIRTTGVSELSLRLPGMLAGTLTIRDVRPRGECMAAGRGGSRQSL